MKLTTLATINGPLAIAALSLKQMSELQLGLSWLGYYAGDIDSLYGPLTRSAWDEFKNDNRQGNPLLIGSESVGLLQQAIDRLDAALAAPASTPEETQAAIRTA